MTRPAMQPANSSAKVARIWAGAIQLLVGPASSAQHPDTPPGLADQAAAQAGKAGSASARTARDG
jgi:hypothetical protein